MPCWAKNRLGLSVLRLRMKSCRVFPPDHRFGAWCPTCCVALVKLTRRTNVSLPSGHAISGWPAGCCRLDLTFDARPSRLRNCRQLKVLVRCASPRRTPTSKRAGLDSGCAVRSLPACLPCAETVTASGLRFGIPTSRLSATDLPASSRVLPRRRFDVGPGLRAPIRGSVDGHTLKAALAHFVRRNLPQRPVLLPMCHKVAGCGRPVPHSTQVRTARAEACAATHKKHHFGRWCATLIQ